MTYRRQKTERAPLSKDSSSSTSLRAPACGLETRLGMHEILELEPCWMYTYILYITGFFKVRVQLVGPLSGDIIY